MKIIAEIAAFIAAGALGWFATAFIGRPIRHFFDLRGDVIRRMAQYANVSARWQETPDGDLAENLQLTGADLARLREAQDVFRDLAAKMRSFAQNERVPNWVVTRFGYDPKKASRGLFGVSNSLDTYGVNRAVQRQAVQDALRFSKEP